TALLQRRRGRRRLERGQNARKQASVANSLPTPALVVEQVPTLTKSASAAHQRLEYCDALRAFFRPYFLRSTARGSRVRKPARLSAGRSSGVTSVSARAMARRSAPAWPDGPPPCRRAWMSNDSVRSTVTRGDFTSCWCTLFGK